MQRTAIALSCLCWVMVSLGVSHASAQAPAEGRRQAGVPAAAAYEADAQRTREALMQVLERHPPALARVLKLDPSLMQSEAYLSAYPQLREFIALHPEVARHPSFYLESVRTGDEPQRRTPQMEMLEDVMAALAAITATAIVGGTLIWIVSTVLDQRRWNRLSKIQAEVHTKLMDRFSSNEELLAYVQTPSGRRFLESGPSPLAENVPAVGAPVSRILWSLQLGAVLLVGGLGMLFLSGRSSVPEASEFFYIAGSVAGALGMGFLVSAVAAYALSRRLGLLDRPTPGAAGHA